MLKWTTYGLIFLINLFLGSFFEGEVGVKIDTPTEVVAGNEFQVKVTIDKGKIESFSRFLQELPAGLKATSVNSSNADFTFRENKVRVIWLKMPETESVTITYTIKVDPRLKGTFDLTGKFSYIENNERISIEADPVTVNISPNPDIDPSLIVDIHDFKEKVIPEITPTGEMPVACFRQKPYASGDEDNSYIVNLLVYKENAQKFAKIEEFLPAGFKAIKIDSKEGIFVFKNNSAKFLWMNLPSSQYFVVSYRLIPLGSVSEPPVLKGQFSYVVDEKTYVKDIIEKDVDLAALSNDDIKRLIDELKASSVVVPKEELVAEKVSQPTEVTEELPKEAKTKPKPVVKPKSVISSTIDLAYKLEPEEGVYYRVQIAAGHKPIDIKRYFRRFKISDEVRAEEHEGWRKYSIGSFSEYRQARDYRVHIWNTTPITDAFVAAYNNGQRITVQEALMITNQKWYR